MFGIDYGVEIIEICLCSFEVRIKLTKFLNLHEFTNHFRQLVNWKYEKLITILLDFIEFNEQFLFQLIMLHLSILFLIFILTFFKN